MTWRDKLSCREFAGVWHKFAFVCVPDISQGMGSGMFPAQNTFLTYKDLYDFAIDYRPVLDYQAALNEASKEDLAIYRKIIDRWVDTDMPTNERVLMRRVTGQLVLNMGKAGRPVRYGNEWGGDGYYGQHENGPELLYPRRVV